METTLLTELQKAGFSVSEVFAFGDGWGFTTDDPNQQIDIEEFIRNWQPVAEPDIIQQSEYNCSLPLERITKMLAEIQQENKSILRQGEEWGETLKECLRSLISDQETYTGKIVAEINQVKSRTSVKDAE